MSFHVYILHSATLNKHYTGFSKYSRKRTKQHRSIKARWTSKAKDWQPIWSESVQTSTEARQLEIKIKSQGAKRFLERLTNKKEE